MKAGVASKAPSPTIILTLVAVAACHAAFAQPAFEPVANDDAQGLIVEQIQAIQSRDGIDSEGLIVPFTELALLYEQSGDHILASAAIDQALYLIRVNRGVLSLDQAPLMRRAIANEEARGDFTAAWEREQELIALARRHPGDLRTVPILHEVADERMALFELWDAYEYPEEIVLRGYCGPLGCSRRAVGRAVVGDAQMYYADAIEVLLRNELYSSDELRALEMELVRTSDLIRERPELDDNRAGNEIPTPGRGSRLNETRTLGRDEIERDPVIVRLGGDPTATRLDQLGPRDAGDESATDESDELPPLSSRVSYYDFGRRALGRFYDYEVASSAPLLKQVNAVVEIADWDLLYSANSSAREGYALAYAALREDAAQAAIEELFSPTTPIVLPAFAPNPLASEETEQSTGYIDVAFRISKLGEPQRIEILDTTTNATDAAQTDLVNLIRRSRFRPRVADGEFRTSPVVVRYYVNE